jgi:Family of unknown function (DUF6455)
LTEIKEAERFDLQLWHRGVDEGGMIMLASTALEHRTTHASKVMERLGIEPGGGALPRLSLLYTTALRRCQSCPSTKVCREWLGGAPMTAGFPPSFCPNFDILLELQFISANSPRKRTLGGEVT